MQCSATLTAVCHRHLPPQKVERLSASLHMVGARPAGKRTVFVEDGCGGSAASFAPSSHLLTPLIRARRSEEALAAMPAAAAARGGGGGGGGGSSDEDEDSDSDGDADGRGAPAPQAARGCVPAAAMHCATLVRAMRKRQLFGDCGMDCVTQR